MKPWKLWSLCAFLAMAAACSETDNLPTEPKVCVAGDEATCDANEECIPNGGASTTEGTCQPITASVLCGAQQTACGTACCDNATQVCDEGICRQGEPCSANEHCASTPEAPVCRRVSGTTEYRCSPLGSLYQYCSPEKGDSDCKPHLKCHEGTKTCLLDAGQPCSQTNGVECFYGRCLVSWEGKQNLCADDGVNSCLRNDTFFDSHEDFYCENGVRKQCQEGSWVAAEGCGAFACVNGHNAGCYSNLNPCANDAQCANGYKCLVSWAGVQSSCFPDNHHNWCWWGGSQGAAVLDGNGDYRCENRIRKQCQDSIWVEVNTSCGAYVCIPGLNSNCYTSCSDNTRCANGYKCALSWDDAQGACVPTSQNSCLRSGTTFDSHGSYYCANSVRRQCQNGLWVNAACIFTQTCISGLNAGCR